MALFRDRLVHFLGYLILVALLPQSTAGPSFVNGQTFTDGLAIIDAPSPNNPGHAGSNIAIAVDVSGDGQLSLSNTTTSFHSLEIYLVSAQTNINLTVSNTSAFLTGEAQSTVKHLNWPIPTCIPSGNYNLTFYESSVFNGQAVFAITPIPIPINNQNQSGQCADLNLLQPQPQEYSSVTLTLTLSNGILNLPTVTVTSKPTPTSVVVISLTTVTETENGTPTTRTETATWTTTVLPSTQGSSGFIPVNAGSHATGSTFLSIFMGICVLYCLL
ncbi:hypothetical protein GGX14DRAFT_421955 [Mycena pura]|uniref:Uncharacterized protein n=1 Tax=Mycena pura TaxID=153505 RepID=A0AAD7E2Z1_9AGAR|nr:hypothetical protein GGX14DRAFT_421955 [Mycena pura]